MNDKIKAAAEEARRVWAMQQEQNREAQRAAEAEKALDIVQRFAHERTNRISQKGYISSDCIAYLKEAGVSVTKVDSCDCAMLQSGCDFDRNGASWTAVLETKQ